MSGETETDSEVNTMIGWLLRRKGWALLADGRFRFLTERGVLRVTPEQLDQLKPGMGEVFCNLVRGFEAEAREQFGRCLAIGPLATPSWASSEPAAPWLREVIAKQGAAGDI